MTLPSTSHKIAAATLSAFALTMGLTACGSDADTSANGGLATVESAPATNDAANTDAAEGENAEAAEGEENKPEEPGQEGEKPEGDKPAEGDAAAAPIPTIANPFGEGEIEVRTYEPIAGGQGGSDADRKEMESVVHTITNPESMVTWTRTILDNSCAAVRDPAMAELKRQGLNLDVLEEVMRQDEKINGPAPVPRAEVSVSDVRVDGDRASATVTSKDQEGTHTSVQLFAKEEGRWKVCTG